MNMSAGSDEGGEGAGAWGGEEGGYGEVVTCDEASLPLCGACEEGELVLIEYDEYCGELECAPERYSLELGLDGVERCVYEELSPPPYNCYDIDLCVPLDEQSCDVITREVVAESDSCAVITGCDDTGAPAIEPRPNDALCNTWGTCNNGVCSAPAVCEAVQRYNTFNRFCSSAVTDAGDTTCTFYVDARGASSADAISCDAFCALSGLTCVDGWNDNNGSCNPTNNNRGCDGDLQSQVCVCSVPAAP